LLYFLVIWTILRPLGIFYGHLVILKSFGTFFPHWYIVPIKIWQPCFAHGPLIDEVKLVMSSDQVSFFPAEKRSVSKKQNCLENN
jgi:hypothetical protein